MRVLIATDGSAVAQTALTAACRILKPAGRDVDVTCVAPEPREGLPQVYERTVRRARHVLDAARHQLAREGVSARTLLRHGSPARMLVKSATEYDVVALGSARAGLGPASSRVLEHSVGTVLICRSAPSDSALRILAPVDGSQAGLDALDRLIEVVNLEQAEVTLLHVVETPWFEPAEAEEPDYEAGQQFAIEAERLLEAARNRLPPRITVNTLIYEGLPGDEIIGEANRGGYDLVVLGASGAANGLKHPMLGSVSSKVAWNAECSVLLVR